MKIVSKQETNLLGLGESRSWSECLKCDAFRGEDEDESGPMDLVPLFPDVGMLRA